MCMASKRATKCSACNRFIETPIDSRGETETVHLVRLNLSSGIHGDMRVSDLVCNQKPD